jgi:hypothetical protein
MNKRLVTRSRSLSAAEGARSAALAADEVTTCKRSAKFAMVAAIAPGLSKGTM